MGAASGRGQEVTGTKTRPTWKGQENAAELFLSPARIMPGWLRGGGVNIPFIHPAKATEYVSVWGSLPPSVPLSLRFRLSKAS